MSLEIGKILEGKIIKVAPYGAFIDIGNGISGLIHISEVSNGYIKEISDYIKVGDVVKAKIISIDASGKIALSIKRAEPGYVEQGMKNRRPSFGHKFDSDRGSSNSKSGSDSKGSFEDMMSKFKQTSDEKFGEIKRNVDFRRGSGNRRGHSK